MHQSTHQPQVARGYHPATHYLLPTPSAPAQARAIIRRTLAAHHLDGHRDTAELLVSELVTNALRHARGVIRLQLSVEGGAVHCEVRDLGPQMPTPRRPDADDEHGRGMLLLDALADAWGIRPCVVGKAVWFALAAAGGLRCS